MFSSLRRVAAISATVLVVSACAGTGSATGSAPAPGPSASPIEEPTATATSTRGSSGPGPGEPWLVYAWYPDSLYVVRPDGSDRQRLELGVEGVPFAPAWSRDGHQIVFVVRGDASATPNGSIWTANADGSGAAMLYDGNGDCADGAYWPSWSPDDKRLAIVCYHTDNGTGLSTVAVLDVATKVRTDYVTLAYPETVDNPPTWSPDGRTLAFDIITWDPTDTFLSQSVVATVPVSGPSATMRRLTDPALFAAHPDWSPDGSLIAFNSYDTGNMHGIDQPSNVYTIAPDGTGLRQVSTASVDGKMRLGQPFWSSDGTRIWVSVARDWEKDSTGQFKNTLGWVDAASGEFHEIGTEGKRFRERPIP